MDIVVFIPEMSGQSVYLPVYLMCFLHKKFHLVLLYDTTWIFLKHNRTQQTMRGIKEGLRTGFG